MGKPPVRHRLVISAVNLVEGGTLRVLQRFTQAARTSLSSDWEVVALVHDERLLDVDGVKLIAFPHIKRSWLRRVWFEYWQCRRLSCELRADVWVALHDMTPNVSASRQIVYCHNALPFYPLSAREALLDWKLLAFKLFYGTLYRINLRRNDMIVVQQEWLRKEFRRRYQANSVVVARPVSLDTAHTAARKKYGTVFLYPTLPRPFKNIELVCEAVRLLERQSPWVGEVRITISGDENGYAKSLLDKYCNLRSVRFIGLQDADAMRRHYQKADCLIFPSRRETWGLPLTEAKQYGLTILAADLPYARESIGEYDGADFFPVDNAEDLASRMLAFTKGKLVKSKTTWQPAPHPYAADWVALVSLIIKDLPEKGCATRTDFRHD